MVGPGKVPFTVKMLFVLHSLVKFVSFSCVCHHKPQEEIKTKKTFIRDIQLSIYVKHKTLLEALYRCHIMVLTFEHEILICIRNEKHKNINPFYKLTEIYIYIMDKTNLQQSHSNGLVLQPCKEADC